MGTDIHGIVQSRWPATEECKEPSKWLFEGEIEDGRNYVVFAILAGVRNGFGFAGVETHNPIEPIAEPRGLPCDFELRDGMFAKHGWLSDEFYEKCPEEKDRDLVWFGDHSFSWLTLQEVMGFDWSQPLDRCGIISREVYENGYDSENGPEEWSGGISGPGIVVVNEHGYKPKGWTHIKVYWTTPIAESCKVFTRWLHYMAAKCEGRETRIVFGFDS